MILLITPLFLKYLPSFFSETLTPTTLPSYLLLLQLFCWIPVLAMAKDVEQVTEQPEYSAKDYHDPPPAPLIDPDELTKWSLYRAAIAEFIATLLFLYITVLTIIGYKRQSDTSIAGNTECDGVGILGIAWAFGGMIFILVYCTAGISGTQTEPSSIFAPVTSISAPIS